MNRLTGSLTGRLLLASAVVLPLFLGATGMFLDDSFRRSSEAAQAQRLQLQVYALLAEAEYAEQLWMPEQLLEARFNQPDSGLYALVLGEAQAVLWHSPSALTLVTTDFLPTLPSIGVGEAHFGRWRDLYHLSYRVVWETESGTEIPLLFSVLETVAPLQAELHSYRRSLLIWLGGSVLLLLACQALILVWGLRPLQRLAGDLARIKSGDAGHLTGDYPREVQAVTDNLNTLLRSEQQRRERTRNTLSDLAHSLKTPLAVIRSSDQGAAQFPQLVREQTDNMEQIIAYQLQRAASGTHNLLQTIPLAPQLARLKGSLQKVYADKNLHIELQLAPNCLFRGDERDLLELLGNLLDNACKYGNKSVRVSARGGGGRDRQQLPRPHSRRRQPAGRCLLHGHAERIGRGSVVGSNSFDQKMA